MKTRAKSLALLLAINMMAMSQPALAGNCLENLIDRFKAMQKPVDAKVPETAVAATRENPLTALHGIKPGGAVNEVRTGEMYAFPRSDNTFSAAKALEERDGRVKFQWTEQNPATGEMQTAEKWVAKDKLRQVANGADNDDTVLMPKRPAAENAAAQRNPELANGPVVTRQGGYVSERGIDPKTGAVYSRSYPDPEAMKAQQASVTRSTQQPPVAERAPAASKSQAAATQAPEADSWEAELAAINRDMAKAREDAAAKELADRKRWADQREADNREAQARWAQESEAQAARSRQKADEEWARGEPARQAAREKEAREAADRQARNQELARIDQERLERERPIREARERREREIMEMAKQQAEANAKVDWKAYYEAEDARDRAQLSLERYRQRFDERNRLTTGWRDGKRVTPTSNAYRNLTSDW